jgi:hypothetical protein
VGDRGFDEATELQGIWEEAGRRLKPDILLRSQQGKRDDQGFMISTLTRNIPNEGSGNQVGFFFKLVCAGISC